MPSSDAELNELMGEVLGGGDGVERNEAELLLLLPGEVPNNGKAETKRKTLYQLTNNNQINTLFSRINYRHLRRRSRFLCRKCLHNYWSCASIKTFAIHYLLHMCTQGREDDVNEI